MSGPESDGGLVQIISQAIVAISTAVLGLLIYLGKIRVGKSKDKDQNGSKMPLNYIERELSDAADNIKDLWKNISELRNDLTQLQGQVNVLKSELRTLKVEVDRLRQRRGNYKQPVDDPADE